MSTTPNDADLAQRRARQKTTITALAAMLILAGAIVLLFLQRVPLPLRIVIGLGDIIAGWGLLILVRQVFAPQKPEN